MRDANLNDIVASIDALVGRTSAVELAAALAAAKPCLLERICDHLGNRVAARALTVKLLNLLMAKHDLRTRAASPWSRPYGLILDPANGCALQCPGCVHSVRSVRERLFDWPSGMLTESAVSRLFRQYGAYAVQAKFCNYGEPLLNPHTPRFIAMAREYLMQTMLSTGLGVRRFDADAYVRSGLDYMVLSIDGATQAVYERYRRNGSLDQALENAARLVDAKRRLGSRTPILCWQFLTFEHNVHELDAAVELARRIGVDEFNAVPPFDVSWDDPSIRPADAAPMQVAFAEELERGMMEHWRSFPHTLDEQAISAALARRWHSERFESGAGGTCQWLYKNMTMDASGRVFPCCGAPDREGGFVVAHIGEAEPFDSRDYRRARAWFGGGDAGMSPAPYCSRCPWVDSRADIDAAHVTAYLRAAAGGLLCEESIRALAEW